MIVDLAVNKPAGDIVATHPYTAHNSGVTISPELTASTYADLRAPNRLATNGHPPAVSARGSGQLPFDRMYKSDSRLAPLASIVPRRGHLLADPILPRSVGTQGGAPQDWATGCEMCTPARV
jgi:hypothetical protein